MTDKEIVEKMIIIAIDKGWKCTYGDPRKNNKSYNLFSKWKNGHDDKVICYEWDVYDNVICNNYLIKEGYLEVKIRDIIFDHNFAKALFGEEICKELCPCNLEYQVGKYSYEHDDEYENGIKWNYAQPMKNWEYHLQQMVLEENPLKYIEKYLKEKGLIK